MIRTVTLKQLVLEELNRQLAESGRDVRIVSERPKPTLGPITPHALSAPREIRTR